MKRRPEHLRSVPPPAASEPMVFAVIPQGVAEWILGRVGRDAIANEIPWLEARGKKGLAAQFALALNQLEVATAAQVARRAAARSPR